MGWNLAKLLEAGELTAVWVPDDRHETMRDLSRARLAAKKDLQGNRRLSTSRLERSTTPAMLRLASRLTSRLISA